MRCFAASLIALLVAAPLVASWHDYVVTPDSLSGNGTLEWTANADPANTLIAYSVSEDRAVFSIAVFGSTVTGFGNALRIKLPDGIVPDRYMVTNGTIDGLGDGDASTPAAIYVRPGDRYVYISPSRGVIAHPAQPVSVAGQITFSVRQEVTEGRTAARE